jgi:hypothetical protein
MGVLNPRIPKIHSAKWQRTSAGCQKCRAKSLICLFNVPIFLQPFCRSKHHFLMMSTITLAQHTSSNSTKDVVQKSATEHHSYFLQPKCKLHTRNGQRAQFIPLAVYYINKTRTHNAHFNPSSKLCPCCVPLNCIESLAT